jgi:hypothetical protein
MTKKILRVAEIQAEVVGQMESHTGAVHDVRPLTFDTYQRLTAADATANSLLELRACVEAVVPTLTTEEVGQLTAASAQAILTLAGAGIEAVEAMFPNAVRPETPSTSPA